MSLTKAIEHGKERRKPRYTSANRYKLGRNHCTCQRCASNRAHKDKKRRLRGCDDENEQLDDFADIFAELG